MMNPICTAGFACAAWIFFRDRIGSHPPHPTTALSLTPQPPTPLSLPYVTELLTKTMSIHNSVWRDYANCLFWERVWKLQSEGTCGDTLSTINWTPSINAYAPPLFSHLVCQSLGDMLKVHSPIHRSTISNWLRRVRKFVYLPPPLSTFCLLMLFVSRLLIIYYFWHSCQMTRNVIGFWIHSNLKSRWNRWRNF